MTDIDYKQLSPFYLTTRPLTSKAKHRYYPSANGFAPLNKGKELYSNFLKRQRESTAIPKARNITLSKRLAAICSPYSRLVKDGNKIVRASKRTFINFKKRLQECGKILEELKRDQDNFQDPETNFYFYVWRASKSFRDNEMPN
eukprot:TRINITY_DN2480_c0_g3_i1.p1 TRINITY_DN2480_c0_g3~~TRINITY_DN2480_c0_g3_i1.p1  ORF type:complete len:144 (+),score=23.63 TRINITY_DN2480_c0_g3_i1:523-954(+)